MRVSANDPFHRKKDEPQPDAGLRTKILAALARFDWNKLEDSQRQDLIRVYHVALNRMGMPSDAEREAMLKTLKQLCGAGGAREGDALVIQGDHRDRIRAKLEALGLRVKLAGG